MKALVTGSSGHLGEALVRTLQAGGQDVVGIDRVASPFTSRVGSITDRAWVRQCLDGVTVVYHAATLHKPHVATHTRQEFVDTNVTGTLNLLEEACAAGVGAFVYTSTTSVFGDALIPPIGEPAAWITEAVTPQPKNIYGVTKAAAEDLCQLFYRNQKLPCIVLRTSRFFPEEDDNAKTRAAFRDDNHKVNEFISRRVEIEDVVAAHLLAAERAWAIGFDKFIISATTPFLREDMAALRENAPDVLRRRVPGYESVYAELKWKMTAGLDRVYVNERARRVLSWAPRYDFAFLVGQLRAGRSIKSSLAEQIGSKGYHEEKFSSGPYPVEKSEPKAF